MPEMQNQEPARWLDEAHNVRKIYRGLFVVCGVLLVGGEALLFGSRSGAEAHGFGFEHWPGFYSFFGFVACVALVLAAKELRKLLMRPEDYYEDGSSRREPGDRDGA